MAARNLRQPMPAPAPGRPGSASGFRANGFGANVGANGFGANVGANGFGANGVGANGFGRNAGSPPGGAGRNANPGRSTPVPQQFDRRATSPAQQFKQSDRPGFFEATTFSGPMEPVATDVTKTTTSFNRSEIEEYLDRSTSLTLADCTLTLEDRAQLRIEWTAPNGQPGTSTLNLDQFIGNHGGRLAWPGSDFSQSCENILLDGTSLVAMCAQGGESDAYTGSHLDLDHYLTYTSGGGFGPIDTDLCDFMATPNWMNFTVVAQPDMGSFLGHPRFRKAVSGVAHRAVDEVMSNMQYVMQHMAQHMVQQMVDEAMDIVRTRSEQRIERDLDKLVQTAASNVAYSSINQFVVMQSEAIQAFNTLAPHINAAPLDQSTPGGPARD
ncbi:hypothetical protein GGX14DRAFT_568286 [Mycena pura]|uniref:Cyanovirin-N domain-containing protein n=1 Tax=Mycena pura TaxID=153505 RepID=A0AAD6V9W6_9AGAR|nr:hypothetical protein GGX14DRAFT_568286 [Mycena pura]